MPDDVRRVGRGSLRARQRPRLVPHRAPAHAGGGHPRSAASGGLAAWAALQVAAEYPADANIVVLLPDSGRGYLSKIFNDDWMASNGFLDRTGSAAHVSARCVGGKGGDAAADRPRPPRRVRCARPSPPCTATPSARCRSSSARRAESHDDVLGSIRERGLLDRVYRDPSVLDQTVSEVMEEPLPIVDSRDTVDHAMGLLTGAGVRRAGLRRTGPRRRAHPRRRARLPDAQGPVMTTCPTTWNDDGASRRGPSTSGRTRTRRPAR